MKNKFAKILTAALGILCLSSCGKEAKTEEKFYPGSGYTECDYVGVKELNEHIFVGEKSQIDLDVMPISYKGKLLFESKNTNVVTVSSSGELTAVAKGLTSVDVKHADGSLICKINVIVTAKDDSNVSEAVSYISSAYADEAYVAPLKAHKIEYSEETYYKDGKKDHGSSSFEEMYFDANKGYFMVGGDDIYTYTLGGNRELNNGKWIFQVLGLKTRMIHITETTKNYFDFNSADYDEDCQVIYDLLDLFFVSGRKIVDDMLDGYSGKSDFEHYAKFIGEEGINVYADENNNIAIDLEFIGEEGEVDVEDELEYLDMYAGTKYIESDYISYVFEGAKCNGMSIHATYNYNYDNSEWKRDFVRSMRFDEDYVPEEYKASDEDMKLDGWAKVDNIYDL